jgi:hypothetical protein
MNEMTAKEIVENEINALDEKQALRDKVSELEEKLNQIADLCDDEYVGSYDILLIIEG